MITISRRDALALLGGFALLFVLGIGVTVAWASHQFSDVPDDHQFHDSIDYVSGAGIANGFLDGTYRPSNPVTRGQMAAFLHRASGNHPDVGRSVDAGELGGKRAAEWQVEIDGQQTSIDALETTVAAQQAQIDTLTSKLQFVSIVDASTAVQGLDTMRISGANLQIVDGSGDTDGFVNGLGNLIIGYNEDTFPALNRTGSHNLAVGSLHSYPSFGGLVAGYNNRVTGSFSSVTGGYANTASGDYSSVSGGYINQASGVFSSISSGNSRSVATLFGWRAGDQYSDPDG